MTPLTVYIGHDTREIEAVKVCRDSILRRSSRPVKIIPLELETLTQAGIYRRRWFRRSDGQRIDEQDRKPFSTDFAFSRFLVPALSLYQGWALFCDCDFLFTADLAGLFELADDRYAVMCVKHEHIPQETQKMDGQEQTRYRRKNWSSFVLWNNAHPDNACITLDCVNKMPGQWLHAFDWLKDEKLGSLPATWNHLVGVSPATEQIPCAIHYTLGIPTMPGYENCQFAELWRQERDSRRVPALQPLPSERVRALESKETTL